MEIKKSPKVDIRNRRGLLLEIGLAAALILVIAAFAYTPKEKRIVIPESTTAMVEIDMTEITREPEKLPEPPRRVEMAAMSELLDIVTNDTKIENDLVFDDFDENTEVFQTVEAVEETIVDDEPFLVAETMPKFQGGDINTFRSWVQQNVKFPQIALENGIQGRVVLSFVIEKDGRLTNIQVLQTPDRSLSEEAIRVLNKSPKWAPGKQRNQTVRVKYTLPVDFRVQN